jgi:hypothetical protein
MAELPVEPTVAKPKDSIMEAEGAVEEGDEALEAKGGNIDEAIDNALNGLSDPEKAFIGAHLTPEITKFVGILFGDAIEGSLSRYADPNMILIPMDRSKVEEQLSAKGAGQGMSAAPQGAPTAQPPQAATPMAAGPTQGPMAAM